MKKVAKCFCCGEEYPITEMAHFEYEGKTEYVCLACFYIPSCIPPDKDNVDAGS